MGIVEVGAFKAQMFNLAQIKRHSSVASFRVPFCENALGPQKMN
jgi:hypothetical protein